MTNREFFNAIINGVASVKAGKTKDAEVNTFPVFTVNEDGIVTVAKEIVEFAKAEIVKLDEKNSKKKGSLSDAQKENSRLADEIFDTLEAGKSYVAKEVATIMEISTQKASALLKKLVEAGKLECGETRVDGRAVKSYTKVAVEDTETDEATEENVETEE